MKTRKSDGARERQRDGAINNFTQIALSGEKIERVEESKWSKSLKVKE